jgi:DNA repair protein RecN (Recombination protein N)
LATEELRSSLDKLEFPAILDRLAALCRFNLAAEMARLMLALKSVLAAGDATPTLVFDEVDVGVGARSGQVVGEKLFGLTSEHQVLVITHLPQIAAFADAHYKINKLERAGRTVSQVDRLEEDDRVTEIAAMLDGVPVTPQSTANAAQLLERVQGWKRTSGLALAG